MDALDAACTRGARPTAERSDDVDAGGGADRCGGADRRPDALLAGGPGGSAGRARDTQRPRGASHRHGPARRQPGRERPRAERRSTRGTSPVPILMYHVIAAAPPGAPFPGLYVTPTEFAEQMHALKGDGWHAVTLDQLEAYWRAVPRWERASRS